MNVKLIVAAAALAAFSVEPALAQDAFGSLATKGETLRDGIVTVGIAFVGAMAAVAFLLAAFNKVSWNWFGMLLLSGAGLTAIQYWQEFFVS